MFWSDNLAVFESNFPHVEYWLFSHRLHVREINLKQKEKEEMS
tara:strand:+ start:1482 stop:1610 length:129 start_codon:yes stop_codon:yes gene_type:complete